MKGVVIFDKSNDIAFLQADDELRIYLNGIAIARGLLEPSDAKKPLDRDVIMQVLSPFMTSQRFLSDVLKTAYHSIQTENGHLFVFMQFNEQIYIAINGDGMETEMFLTRKLSVLNRIIRFILGPLLDELKPESLVKRSERWNFIGQILSTWCRLHDSEQAFLVEAPERLHINPELNGKCVAFLEWAFTAIKSKEDGAIHSMLLINNKLLSLFSDTRAPAVDVSDQMMIIILVQSLLSSSSLNKSKYSSPLSRISQSSFNERTVLGENQIQSISSDDVPQGPFAKSGSSEGAIVGNDSKAADPQLQGDEGPEAVPSDEDIVSSVGESSLDLADNLLLLLFEKRVVFLRRGSTNSVPHLLHCVPVTVDITLVFVCQISRVEDSTALVRFLEILNLVMRVSWKDNIGSATAAAKTLDSSVKAILNIAQHYGNSEMVSGPVKMLADRWKEVNTPSLLVHLEEGETSGSLDQRVRFDLQQMYSQALNLFYRLFFVPRALTTDEEDSQTKQLQEIQMRLRASLGDYAKFLHAKSLNNLTLTSYLELYPGMIHFLYVDRATNQMTGTSFAVGSDRESNNVQSLIIKKNMWKLIELTHENLLQGCTSTLIRKGDYYYSYSLWFEDTTGKPLAVNVPFKTTQRFLLPGIIAHNFYKKLVSRCFGKNEHSVNCYELITVHTANMPKSLMHDQRQKLISRLVQASAASSSPLPLF